MLTELLNYKIEQYARYHTVQSCRPIAHTEPLFKYSIFRNLTKFIHLIQFLCKLSNDLLPTYFDIQSKA